MIKDFQPRLYQQTILGTAVQKNTLVVLPTGLGKTAIAFLLSSQRLSMYENGKILMLAPTKPLCEQHCISFQKHLNIPKEKIVVFTGSVTPKKREEKWKEAKIIISTPQGLENDIINNRIGLKEVVLLIFDEAHHATGEYSYVWIAQQYEKIAPRSRILALTASPGSDLDKIKEVCSNLAIENVEVRTDNDPDVKEYIQEIQKKWVKVPFPEEFKKIQKFLKECRKSKLIEAQKHGYCSSSDLRKTDLLMLQGELQKKISSGDHGFEVLRSISLVAEALKVDHALELLETQGLRPLSEYFEKIQQQSISTKVKAVKNLMIDANFKSAIYLTNELVEKGVQHPKVTKLIEIVSETIAENEKAKIIIFTQFRDSAEEIVKRITSKVSCHIFFGQAKKKGVGFSQKQQKEILDKFRVGEFQVLVATSVAEEGLDIPKVQKVIFYEPIPSAIRSIQRRGRTGRLEKGEVTILVTEGTRDEGYRWSSHHKEKRMYRNLEKLKNGFSLNKKQQELHSYIEEKVVAIVADHRENSNRVVKELISNGISVRTAQLESADYIVSGTVGVELKTVNDFVASIIDGRLLDQMKGLKRNFEKSVLIVEGEEDIYSVRKVHANAIRGMISAISLDFGVPIIHTKNAKDTAGLLAVMAQREQKKDRSESYQRKPQTIREQQEQIIASFPNVGVGTAKKILEHFSSIANICSASLKEIQKVEGVGKKTAEKIREVAWKEYLPK